MRIPAGITLIVLGAILTFALKGGHIGSLDLHAVGVILMLAGPSLADPSLADPALANPALANPALANPALANPALNGGRRHHGPRQRWSGSAPN